MQKKPSDTIQGVVGPVPMCWGRTANTYAFWYSPSLPLRVGYALHFLAVSNRPNNWLNKMRIRFRNVSVLALTLVSFMALPALADDTTSAGTPSHSSGPVDGAVKGSENEGFWKRLSQSYG